MNYVEKSLLERLSATVQQKIVLAWIWYVKAIKQTPQILENIRKGVWENDQVSEEEFDDMGTCPIESEGEQEDVESEEQE